MPLILVTRRHVDHDVAAGDAIVKALEPLDVLANDRFDRLEVGSNRLEDLSQRGRGFFHGTAF